MLATTLFYLVSVYFVLQKRSANPFSGARGGLLLVVLAAIVFRLTVAGMFPQFSDDAFRYRWEGMLQEHGGNPYQAWPAEPRWKGLRDATFARVGSKDVKSSYGPLIQQIEKWTYRAVSGFTRDPFRQVFWFKTPSMLFDLGVLLVLGALLRQHGLAPERILVYAWSPLPLVEFWATGHNDSIAIFFVLLALLAAGRRRWWLAFAALTLAVDAKIWPLLLFPLFVGWRPAAGKTGWRAVLLGRPDRWYQWLIALPITGLLVWPYWSNVEQNIRFMTGFVGGWRNHDSIYGLLLWITGDQYPAKYTAFAMIGAAVLVVTLLRWPLVRASLLVVSVLLLVSANCHCWYLTWMLPFLAFYPVGGLLLWTLLAPLSYRVVIDWALLGVWHGSTPWRWIIYGPVFAVLAGEGWAWLWRRRRKAVSAPEGKIEP